MKTIRIMQLGDMHFPSSAGARRAIDDKDSSFPSLTRDAISSSPLKTVLREAYSTIEKLNIDTLLSVGDLTDYGNLIHYENCAEYISDCLLLPPELNRKLTIVVVPGNHDIDRKLARQPGISAKFRPLSKAAKARGFADMPTDGVVRIPLKVDNAEVEIFALNSCWGCGEPADLPSDFKQAIDEAIERVLDQDFTKPKTRKTMKARADRQKALHQYYDYQLDTPAFSIKAVGQLKATLATLKDTTFPIIVAHHNLLPQRIPRIAPYTELVNGGVLRGSLLDADKPALYLHGHTHEDTTEIVTSPNIGHLAIISAPLIIDGFNVLEVTFTDAGMPIGVRLRPWRFDKSGVIGEQQGTRMPLRRPKTLSTEPQYGIFYGKLLQKSLLYWNDVIAIAEAEPLRFAADHIRELLELLAFERRIDIEHMEADVNHWIVRARV